MTRSGFHKITYGLIGFGGLAENRIVKEGFGFGGSRSRTNPYAELSGVTDISAVRRERASELGLNWYDSVDHLLADDSIQAVFIATHNSSHHRLTKEALVRGKHCIVEKPMATSLENAAELCRLAGEHRKILSVDHMMIHNAYNVRARKLIAAGSLGQVNDFSIHMEFSYGADAGERRTWRCSDPGELGGPVGDVGSHCLYMAEFLTGSEIARLSCTYTPRTLPIEVENGALIQIVMKNGIQGIVRVAFNQPRGGPESTLLNLGYEIYGTAGILRACGTMFQLSGARKEPVALRMYIESARKSRRVRIRRPANIYAALIAKHASAVMEKKGGNGEEGVHNLKLILACHESALNGSLWLDIAS